MLIKWLYKHLDITNMLCYTEFDQHLTIHFILNRGEDSHEARQVKQKNHCDDCAHL